jgi:hypothetical protein
MLRVKANGIEIEYEEFGASQEPLNILIAGFGDRVARIDVEARGAVGLPRSSI